MKITIQQRQPDGSNKKVVINGNISKSETNLPLDGTIFTFLTNIELEINSKANLRIWIQ